MIATVIIPTFDHGALLEHSLASALAQTVTDIEVLVIGDGIPDPVRPIVEEIVAVDGRVRLLDHPKSPRTGEPYRHEALQHARGDVVCYLSDDDLWLPDHIERLLPLLAEHDFVNAVPTWIAPDGTAGASVIDLSLDHFRQLHLSGESRIPLTFGAHTLDAYRRLPHGWRTTPRGRYTDWYMWAQFLETDGMRCASASVPTAIHFSSAMRRDLDDAARLRELEHWRRAIDDPAARLEFVERVIQGHGGPRHAASLEAILAARDGEIAACHELIDARGVELAAWRGRADRAEATLAALRESRVGRVAVRISARRD